MSSILKVDTIQDANGNAIISSDGSGNLTPNTFTALTVSGDLTVDTDTLYVDSADNRVGIGTTNPDSPLHVLSTSVPPAHFQRNTSGTLSVLLSPTGTNTQWSVGAHSDGYFRITNEGVAERMRLGATEAVINEGSADYDFRVESDTNTHALFVRGSDGNIGVGANSPSSALEILSNSSSTPALKAQNASGASATTSIFDAVNGGGNVRLRVQNDGKVGIGTTSPAELLHIESDTNGEQVDIRFRGLTTTAGAGRSANVGFDPDPNDNGNSGEAQLYLSGDASSKTLVATASGNVGIGTTSPSSALEVAGTIKGTVTDNSLGLILESTDDDAAAGPRIQLKRNSATPADGDVLGQIVFGGVNDNVPEGHQYARIQSKIQDASNATEDGVLDFLTSVASSEGTSRIYIDSTGVTINDESIDSDFRVESNTQTHMFFVDGGNDNIGIKTSTPDTTVDLDIQGNMQVGDTGSLQMLVGKAIADDYNWGTDGTTVNNRAFSLISDQGSFVQALYFGDAGAATSAIFSISSGTGGTFANRFRVDCDGDVTIAGALSKGSGSFKIDHPLPEKTDTHHLVHSFVEAPQADNIYRGKVDLVNGTATVNIDTVAGMSEGTFVLLNREIQCFTSNETGWTAVKGSVSENILTITAQDETCTDTISWLVIGERQDQHMYDTRWTDENGKVMVEPLK